MRRQLPATASGDLARRVLALMRDDGLKPGDAPTRVKEVARRTGAPEMEVQFVYRMLHRYGYLGGPALRPVILILIGENAPCGALNSVAHLGSAVTVRCNLRAEDAHEQHEARNPAGRTVRWRSGEAPE